METIIKPELPADEPFKRGRGFASMTPERRKEIAAAGGRAVKRQNRAFSRDPELAAAAGRKGGRMVDPANRTFFKDRNLAREAGRKGGWTTQKKLPVEPVEG